VTLSRAKFVGGLLVEVRGHGQAVQRGAPGCLGFGERHVADRAEQRRLVEPVDPFERGVFDRFEPPPGPAAVDDLGLEEADDALGERVVIAVADAADRRLDADFRQALGVADRDVQSAPVAVVGEAALRAAVVQSRLERV
jgi:hypothetical protein